MKLTLINIGKIKNSSVEINGITVIAGENNTGKSTVGKALFSLFTAFHNIDENIKKERFELIGDVLTRNLRPSKRRRTSKSRYKELINKLCDNRDFYIEDELALIEQLNFFYEDSEFAKIELFGEEYDRILRKIHGYLRIEDEEIKNSVLKKSLVAEYDMQIGNVNNNGENCQLILEIHNEKIAIQVINNESIQINSSFDIYSNLIYIEDPFALDELNYPLLAIWGNEQNHRGKLVEALSSKRKNSVVNNAIEELFVSEKLENIFKILNNICDGSIGEVEEDYKYNSPNFSKPLTFSNISTGFKTFLVLKTLLMNGTIEEHGTIVLDEPEIHLHPEWQLIFAEIIILIQKELGMHILLTTHSPYFLNAIEVYSAKYGIADKCKYYLAENHEDYAIIKDVTMSIEEIYSKLARPLQDLENLRWSND